MNLYFNGTSSVFFQDSSLKDDAWRSLNTGERVGLVVRDDPFPPAYNSSVKPKTLIDRVQLGDGYEQVTESGVRSQKLMFDLRWTALSDKRITALQRFFTGEGTTSIYNRRPSEWFWWFPPTPLSRGVVLPIKVLCVDGWSSTAVTWNSNDLSATFEESFQP